jgi:hypothetical protein
MNRVIPRLILLFLIIGFAACTRKRPGEVASEKKKYSIYVMMKDGKEYLVQTDSLSSGHIKPVQEGTKVVPARLFYDLIAHNGKYYRVDWKTDSFVRYRVENKIFTKEAELTLKGISAIENYQWLSPDSLFIVDYDAATRKVRYAAINVNNMKARQGETEIAGPSGIFNSMSIGFLKFLDKKLLVGYTYHAINNLNSFTTSDTIYVDVLSYPSLKFISRSVDTRSAYPGGVNTRQSHFFSDENGDFYFIACPGIAAGNNPDKPTGIFRIKKSQTGIDPDYFFNISVSKIQNHGYGFWYIGNGKAIVRTERKGFFTGMNDHWKVPHFDFFEIDLEHKTTSRLPLPLDKGTARQCVLVEDGVVYITVNSDSQGSRVWLYDPIKKSLTKGLQFDHQVDYLLRLERLN